MINLSIYLYLEMYYFFNKKPKNHKMFLDMLSLYRVNNSKFSILMVNFEFLTVYKNVVAFVTRKYFRTNSSIKLQLKLVSLEIKRNYLRSRACKSLSLSSLGLSHHCSIYSNTIADIFYLASMNLSECIIC